MKFWPYISFHLSHTLHQQLQRLHLALLTTCLVLQLMDCIAPCLNLNPSRSSNSLLHPAAACPPAHSMALDQFPTLLKAALFSHTILLPHHQAPPWGSAALVALLVWAWALLSEASAPLVSVSGTRYMKIKESVFTNLFSYTGSVFCFLFFFLSLLCSIQFYQ